MFCIQLLQQLETGVGAGRLAQFYAPDGSRTALAQAKERAVQTVRAFQEEFNPMPYAHTALFSGPGRTELGGNHTDHQHGRVLCASVDLDILACAAPNELGVVRIHSQGYPLVEVSLDDLEVRGEEKNTSAALVRGVAAKLTQMGYALTGFDAYAVSNVLSGSGLSSSAAYEILIGNIFNHFCCGGRISAIELAKVGQYAENVYFGKPCGLMDQMGSSVGGAVAIDFNDPAEPVVERIGYDFGASGHDLCIVDTGSSHDDLTDDYAGITREMGAVAAHFKKKVLRDVPESEFRSAVAALRKECGDRAVLRAMHFYADDRRAVQEASALKQGNFQAFLNMVNASGLSSSLRLQNTWSPAAPARQAVPLSLAFGRELLGGTGSIRVHGGGFAGTIQAFVPHEKLTLFKTGMENLLGKGKCHVVHIRPTGGCVVLGD